MSTTVIIAVVVALVIVIALVAMLRKPAVPQLEDLPPAELDSPAKQAPSKLDEKPGKAPSLATSEPEEPSDSEALAEGVSAARPSAITITPDSVEDDSPKPPPAPAAKRKRDVSGLRKGLAKVRDSGGMFGRLKALLGGKKEIAAELVDEIEEILLTSDVGMATTERLLEEIRDGLEKKDLTDTERVWDTLRERAINLVSQSGGGAIRNHGQPTVVLMVGVNGTGKTTTIGKLATKLADQGKRLLLVAGDTFRAAAVEQLKVWGERIDCPVFAGEDGADPASVVFDAVKHGVEAEVDVILVDTAGRLHTKANLMDELSKVVRTTGKALAGAPHETLLVVDGTTGQNAIQQAELFNETLPLSGIVLTKLDGTAKGGVVLAIAAEHQVPVRYVGVGERAEDLRDFDPEEFVEAMLGQGNDAAEAA